MQKLPTEAENLKTLIVLALALLSAHLIWQWSWALWLTVMFLVIAAFSQYFTSRIAWIWLSFAHVIGKVNSTLILSLSFFLVLTPLAWLRKLFVRNSLDLQIPQKRTLFHTRNHRYTPQDLENPW